MCVVVVYVLEWGMCLKDARSIWSPVAGVTGICELLNMGAGEQNLLFYKTGPYSSPLGHPPAPVFPISK